MVSSDVKKGQVDIWPGLDKDTLLKNIAQTDKQLEEKIRKIEEERETLRLMKDMVNTINFK